MRAEEEDMEEAESRRGQTSCDPAFAPSSDSSLMFLISRSPYGELAKQALEAGQILDVVGEKLADVGPAWDLGGISPLEREKKE